MSTIEYVAECPVDGCDFLLIGDWDDQAMVDNLINEIHAKGPHHDAAV